MKDFRREIEGLDRQYHAGEMSILDYANKRDDTLDEYHSLLMGRVKCVTDIFSSVDAAMIAADEYTTFLSSSSVLEDKRIKLTTEVRAWIAWAFETNDQLDDVIRDDNLKNSLNGSLSVCWYLRFAIPSLKKL